MKTRILAPLVTALVSVIFTAELPAQGTPFTYQGQLTDTGQTVNDLKRLVRALSTSVNGGAE